MCENVRAGRMLPARPGKGKLAPTHVETKTLRSTAAGICVFVHVRTPPPPPVYGELVPKIPGPTSLFFSLTKHFGSCLPATTFSLYGKSQTTWVSDLFPTAAAVREFTRTFHDSDRQVSLIKTPSPCKFLDERSGKPQFPD